MKKAVLAALGILTVTCTGTMPIGSFAAETEITDSAMEEEGTAEKLETGSETESVQRKIIRKLRRAQKLLTGKKKEKGLRKKNPFLMRRMRRMPFLF